MHEAAVGNALSPTVDSRTGGTISADVDDGLSLCLQLMSATRRSSSQRYSGAKLCRQRQTRAGEGIIWTLL